MTAIRKLKLADVPDRCDSCGTDLAIGQTAVQIEDVFWCVPCARRLRDGLIRALGPDKTVN